MVSPNFKKSLNDYVSVFSIEDSKTWVVIDMFLSTFFLMFYVGYSFIQKFNFFKSEWIIFIPIVAVLDFFGIYLLANIRKRQIEVLLFHGISGLYWSVELFILSFTYGTSLAHIQTWAIIIPIIPDALLIGWIIWRKVKLFKRLQNPNTDNESKSGLISSRTIPSILIIGPIINLLTNRIETDTKYFAGTICFLFLGYVMSIFIVYICNYLVAGKYKQYIYSMENNTKHNRK